MTPKHQHTARMAQRAADADRYEAQPNLRSYEFAPHTTPAPPEASHGRAATRRRAQAAAREAKRNRTP